MSKYINKISLTVAIVLLFIPTIIAFIYLSSGSTNITEIPKNATMKEIEIISPTGKKDTITDKALLALIENDLNTADAFTDTTGLPLYEAEAFTMNVKLSYSATAIASEKKYICYINADSRQCYFKSDDGKVFIFNSLTAQEILKLEICSNVIPYSVPAQVIYSPEGTDETTLLEPYEVNWSYIDNKGETIKIDKTSETAATISVSYKKNSRFADRFVFGSVDDKFGNSHAPSSVYVKAQIKSDGEFLESTLIDGIDGLLSVKNFESDTALVFYIDVTWGSEDMSDGFFGTATYKVNVNYDVPASFEISDEAVTAGNLPLIKAKNLSDGETVSSKIVNTDTNEEYGLDLNFVNYNGVKIAFVPFDCTAKKGTYSITLTTSDTEQTLSIRIKQKVSDTKNFGNMDASKVSNNYGDNAKLSFSGTMADVYNNRSDTKLWQSKGFALPISGATKTVTYGNTIKFKSGNDEYTETAMCNIYTSKLVSAQVSAANDGVVVYVGETSITGKLVVIEHGFGLKTWYWNLGLSTVQAGDNVTKGQAIGTVGNTGFCREDANQLAFATSIDDVFINPELYFNKGLDYFDK